MFIQAQLIDIFHLVVLFYVILNRSIDVIFLYFIFIQNYKYLFCVVYPLIFYLVYLLIYLNSYWRYEFLIIFNTCLNF